MVFPQVFSALLIASVSFAPASSFAIDPDSSPSVSTRDAAVWVARANMPVTQREVCGGVIDGKFYVVADGYTAVYDPELDVWNDALPPILTNRDNSGVACALDGKLYVMGGMGVDGPPLPFDPQDINEMYNPVTNAWSTMQPMPTPMFDGAVAAVDGKIYRINSAATEAYVPALDDGPGGQDAWATMETAPSSIGEFFDAAVVDGKIYIFGGNLSASLVYDPAKDDGPGGESAWSSVAAIPTGRNWPRATSLHGKVHVLAGQPLTGGTTDAHDIYDPVTNTWSEGAPNQVQRFSFAAGVIDNSIYMAGGLYFSTGAVGTNSLEQYTEILEPAAAKNWTFY